MKNDSKTKLVEFSNSKKEILRGIITLPENKIKQALICIHGFERFSSCEKKFKILADKLVEKNIATFRFDFAGCGLSDGDFGSTTIKKQGEELFLAKQIFKKIIGKQKINFFTHSLGACVLARQAENILTKEEKIILMSPALNQKDLLRYWFVNKEIKEKKLKIEINWENYQDYLNEENFLKDCRNNKKTTKLNHIKANYFLENQDLDYSPMLKNFQKNILHIHGENDIAVPIKSLTIKFSNKIIVKKGDHDLEKPDQFKQWLKKAVNFFNL